MTDRIFDATPMPLGANLPAQVVYTHSPHVAAASRYIGDTQLAIVNLDAMLETMAVPRLAAYERSFKTDCTVGIGDFHAYAFHYELEDAIRPFRKFRTVKGEPITSFIPEDTINPLQNLTCDLHVDHLDSSVVRTAGSPWFMLPVDRARARQLLVEEPHGITDKTKNLARAVVRGEFALHRLPDGRHGALWSTEMPHTYPCSYIHSDSGLMRTSLTIRQSQGWIWRWKAKAKAQIPA